MNTLLNLLNVTDSGFPTGSYGHSSGLEYAVQKGWVTDRDEFSAWALRVLNSSFLTLDVRAALKAYYCQNDSTFRFEIEALNDELSSFRTSAVQREASAQVGRSFFKSFRNFYGCADGRISEIEEWIQASERAVVVQFPVVWGACLRSLDLTASQMAEALIFSAVRQMTFVAIRIVPLGQNDAFQVQTQLLQTVKLPFDLQAYANEKLESLAVGLELAGLGQENLERRYFRS